MTLIRRCIRLRFWRRLSVAVGDFLVDNEDNEDNEDNGDIQ